LVGIDDTLNQQKELIGRMKIENEFLSKSLAVKTTTIKELKIYIQSKLKDTTP
jgi:hypothetical protein